MLPRGEGLPPPPTVSSTTAAAPLRRLSRAEYGNTLNDLLGVAPDSAAPFAVDLTGGSGFPEGGAVGGPELERLMETMESVAKEGLARAQTLSACDVAKQGEEECADDFIKTVGRRLYRHPLSSNEAADLKSVYADARKVIGYDFKEALRTTLLAMLMSPRFHYHWELGDRTPLVKGDLVAYDEYELASRLSYLFWQSAPDDELLAAADRGELTSPKGMLVQAKRMLSDATKGPRVARAFLDGWMELGDLDQKASGPDGPVLQALRESARRFAEDFVNGDDRSFRALLTSPAVYVNEITAKIYGVDPVKGTDWKRLSAPEGKRAGALTLPAFLASQYNSTLSTPVRRGRFVYEKLASCAALPPPIPVIPEPPAQGPNDSVRDHLTKFTGEGVCAGCHGLMNPYGFALGGYDRLGQARDKDEYGEPIDTKVTLPDVGGMPVMVADAIDMARKIADSAGARACFTQQVFQYAVRRPVDAGGKAAVTDLDDRFGQANGDLRELFLASTQMPTFYYRKPAKDEVLR